MTAFLRPPNIEQWFRVIARNDEELVINPYGVEEPNIECAFVEGNTLITEEQASIIPELHAEWRALRYYKELNESNQYDKSQRHVKDLSGYIILTEDLKRGLYWWDAEESQERTYEISETQALYVMKRLIWLNHSLTST